MRITNSSFQSLEKVDPLGIISKVTLLIKQLMLELSASFLVTNISRNKYLFIPFADNPSEPLSSEVFDEARTTAFQITVSSHFLEEMFEKYLSIKRINHVFLRYIQNILSSFFAY